MGTLIQRHQTSQLPCGYSFILGQLCVQLLLTLVDRNGQKSSVKDTKIAWEEKILKSRRMWKHLMPNLNLFFQENNSNRWNRPLQTAKKDWTCDSKDLHNLSYPKIYNYIS